MPDTTDLVTENDFNTKFPEIESKLPKVNNFVKKTNFKKYLLS